MSAKARIMVYRDIVFDDDGDSNDILDVACIPFSIGTAKDTGKICSFTSKVTSGSLDVSSANIKQRKSSGEYIYTADVYIIPNTGFKVPTSVTVASSPACTSYDFEGSRIRIKWSTLPNNASATITAICPAVSDTSKLGEATLGTMILGKS